MNLIECPECFGIGAPCGNLGDNNHCDNCSGTGKVDPIEKACEGLISQLLRAREEIGHWIAFAERQMRELPDWEHLPCGPTTNGVRESEALRAEIAGVVRHYRQVTRRNTNMAITKDDVIRQLLEDIAYCAHRHEVQTWKDCPGTPEERLHAVLKHARSALAVMSGKLRPTDAGDALAEMIADREARPADTAAGRERIERGDCHSCCEVHQ